MAAAATTTEDDAIVMRMKSDIGFFFAMDKAMLEIALTRRARLGSTKEGHCTECGKSSELLKEFPVDRLCMACCCAAKMHSLKDGRLFVVKRGFTTVERFQRPKQVSSLWHDDDDHSDAKWTRTCASCGKTWPRKDTAPSLHTKSVVRLAILKDTSELARMLETNREFRDELFEHLSTVRAKSDSDNNNDGVTADPPSNV